MKWELAHNTDKVLYVVRHCQSSGQQPDAPLTQEGKLQAALLSDFFSGVQVERIVSSPFLRAYQSITPLAEKLGITIEVDDRLKEKVLSTKMLPDWLEWVRQSFDDLDLCLVGGESGRTAMQRVVTAVDEIFLHDAKVTIIVTHGKLMTLLLKHFDEQTGFTEWQGLTNPDVYKVMIVKDDVEVKRVWEQL
jgi:2,3-bisphosphoglycerate-dependent phosphoglycerate mutase